MHSDYKQLELLDRWLANTPLELEQKASLCYLLTSCSSEFVEFFNRLFTPPLTRSFQAGANDLVALEDEEVSADNPVEAVGEAIKTVMEEGSPPCPPILRDRWTGGELGVAADEARALEPDGGGSKEDPGVWRSDPGKGSAPVC